MSAATKILYLSLILEALTCVSRFGLGLESTRDTASTIGVLTMGRRIHHGYIGLLMMPLGWLLRKRSTSKWGEVVFVVGSALVASDLIHHFLVLWPITGSPHFHLTYPSP